MAKSDIDDVWDYLDGKTNNWPVESLNRVACSRLKSWNRGWITEDILAEGHLLFWQKCASGGLRRDVSPTALFTTIVLNLLRKEHGRRMKRRVKVLFNSDVSEIDFRMPDADHSLPERWEVERADMEERILGVANEHLWGAERDRFLAHVLDGVDQKDIAEAEGVGAPTISMSLKKAKEKVVGYV